MGKVRNRVAEVCTFCKRRKTKCNKGKPCSSCVKYGNDDCVYELAIKVKLEVDHNRRRAQIENEMAIYQNKLRKLEQELETTAAPALIHDYGLKFKEYRDYNPIGSPQDQLLIFTHYIHRIPNQGLRRNNGPFELGHLLRHDPALASGLKFMFQEYKLRRLDIHGDTKVLSHDLRNVERRFEAKEAILDGSSDISYYDFDKQKRKYQNHMRMAAKDSIQVKQEANEYITPINLFSKPQKPNTPALNYSKREDECKIIPLLTQAITSVLPTKNVIFILVDNFFENFYPMYPIIDQGHFLESITPLIGGLDEDNTMVSIKIEKRVDFAHMGILLLVIRLSYLSMISNSHRGAIHDLEAVRGSPINLDVVRVANQCLDVFDIFNTVSIDVFQLLLLTRIYCILAPEEGDMNRGNEISTYNSVLVSRAIALGLNRDPKLLYGPHLNSRQQNLSRKLWATVYLLSIQHSVSTGHSVLRPGFEVSVPYKEDFNDNCFNSNIEATGLELCNRKMAVNEELAKAVAVLLNSKGTLFLQDMTSAMKVVEGVITSYPGVMCKRLVDPQSFKSEIDCIWEIQTHTSASCLLLTTLFFGFNFYEDKDSTLASYYMKKMIMTYSYDLLPLCYQINLHSHIFLKDSGDMFVVPSLVDTLERGITIFLALFIRMKDSTIQAEATKDHLPKLAENAEYARWYNLSCVIQAWIDDFCRVLFDILQHYSARYFAAWRSTKMFLSYYSVVQDKQLFRPQNTADRRSFKQNTSQLQELYEILAESKKTLDDIRQVQPELTSYQINGVSNGNILSGNDVSRGRPATDLEIDKIWQEMVAVKAESTKLGDFGSEALTPFLDDNFFNDFF